MNVVIDEWCLTKGGAMTWEEWEASVPLEIRQDTLWKMEVYRLGLFLSDLAWEDGAKLLKERRTLGYADQLCRAAANISSNVAEGYSRNTGKDRARFYEYALGSVREARDWIYKSRHVLGEHVTAHRLDLSSQAIRLLIRMIANERKYNRRIAGD
jgi:four helix bundle protein